ncbi:MAG: hypothetical protein M0039_00435 [Pseudomonadota bacterium]|nr:hypothetical protein [Pseudomonadota bacterium]
MIVLRMLLYSIITLVILVLVILLGQKGAWYFAWVLGTVMMVLIAAAGAALLDTQEESGRKQ